MRMLVVWVLIALQANSHADALYVDASGWAGFGITGRYRTAANFQLSSGWARTTRRANGDIESELHVGAWFETGKLYGDVDATETGYIGIEAAYGVALGCTCLRLGPRVALGSGGDGRVWTAVGARLQLGFAWLGLEAIHTGAGANAYQPGEPAPHTALELGLGLDLHPRPIHAAIAAGVVVSAFVTFLIGLSFALKGS